jgi:hypothetical protein
MMYQIFAYSRFTRRNTRHIYKTIFTCIREINCTILAGKLQSNQLLRGPAGWGVKSKLKSRQLDKDSE